MEEIRLKQLPYLWYLSLLAGLPLADLHPISVYHLFAEGSLYHIRFLSSSRLPGVFAFGGEI